MHKAAGIIIKDKSLLVLRSKGKEIFFAPGGKLDLNETSKESLVRELKEEINIQTKNNDISFFNSFSAPAAGNEEVLLKMDIFFVHQFQGIIEPKNEIEEILWLNSNNLDKYNVSSIFRDEVFPLLKLQNLID